MYFSYFTSSFVPLGQQQAETGGNVKSQWLVRVKSVFWLTCALQNLGLSTFLFLLNHRGLWKDSGLVQRGVLRGIKEHLLHDVIGILLSFCICGNNEAIGGPSAFHFNMRKLSEIGGNVDT